MTVSHGLTIVSDQQLGVLGNKFLFPWLRLGLILGLDLCYFFSDEGFWSAA